MLPCLHPIHVSEALTEQLKQLVPHIEEPVAAELCRNGTITENDLLEVYSVASGLPVFDEQDVFVPTPLPNINTDFLNRYQCIPYEQNDSVLTLLLANPLNAAKLYYHFKKLTSLDVHFQLARQTLIERLITAAYSNDDGENIQPGEESEDTLRALAGEARIVRLVNDIFIRAQEMRASDIHVEPESERLVFRFRIDGELIEIMECPPEQYPAIVSRIKLVGGLNIAESRRPQDGRTSFRLGGNEFDVRISTVPTMKGESIVLRLLSRDSISFDLTGIGMSSEIFESFEKLINIPHGIILVVGPTGSGKTTTLYSVISRIDSVKRKIITIEDPVEYQFERLSQIPVNPQIGLTFAAGLRHIVRQDPDVILVGEIRDKETADIAINAALTGHLVLSTLHTNDAAGAITRLLDLGVENFLVSSALFGVLSQRLVRIVCHDCNGTGTNYNLTGGRCRTCSGTGFKGRTGVFELLAMNEEIRSAVIAGKSSTQIAAIARSNGMVTLGQDATRKVEAGITTEAEAARVSMDLY